MSKIDFNNPKEVQNELERLLNERFGQNFHISKHPSDNAKDAKAKAPKNVSKDEDSQQFDILDFQKTPKELKQHLDRYVIGQDEAKKTLSIAICNHYNQLKYYHSLSTAEQKEYEYSKQNVLLIGPTGVGKTYMVRQIAKMIDVPFVKADATKYSETGYMGGNVEDLIKDLVNQAGDDLTRAEHGIVYIDEADKLATSYSPSGHSKDISGRGVQLGLLKMLEDTEIDLRSGNDPASQMQALMDMQTSGGKPKPKVINTRHILFILSGAFTDLENIVAKRLSAKAIGFMHNELLTHSQKHPLHFLTEVNTQDLVEYGYEPEFVGRLPVRVACHPLSQEDLFNILKTSHGSIIHQFQRSFAAYDIHLSFDDDALHTIAKLALKENTGARSLVTILDRSLKHFIFELPSTSIRSLQVDAKLITDPESVLSSMSKTITKEDNLPLKTAIKKFTDSFYEKHHIPLNIHEDTYDLVPNKDPERMKEFLENTLQPFEYALKIIAQNEDKPSITLHKHHLEKPHEAFEQWIVKSFRAKKQPAPKSHSQKPQDTLKENQDSTTPPTSC